MTDDSHLPAEDQFCDVCQVETDHVFCWPETPDSVDPAAEVLTELHDTLSGAAA